MKFERDYELLSKTNEKDENEYFTDLGMDLISQFKESYKKCITNWGKNLVMFNLNNQPYNFSYSKFLELNPLLKYEFQ